jgi:hypothetical protein
MMNQRCTTLDQKENEEYQKVSIGGTTMFNIDKTETRRNMEWAAHKKSNDLNIMYHHQAMKRSDKDTLQEAMRRNMEHYLHEEQQSKWQEWTVWGSLFATRCFGWQRMKENKWNTTMDTVTYANQLQKISRRKRR